jgi:hypothetical protein
LNAIEPQYLYLTTTGHKSGKPHQIEIWFVEHEGRFYLVAEHRERTHWAQNIMHKSSVEFYTGTRTQPGARYRGIGRIVNPDEEPALAAAVSALMDAKYEWSDGLIVELVPVEAIEG